MVWQCPFLGKPNETLSWSDQPQFSAPCLKGTATRSISISPTWLGFLGTKFQVLDGQMYRHKRYLERKRNVTGPYSAARIDSSDQRLGCTRAAGVGAPNISEVRAKQKEQPSSCAFVRLELSVKYVYNRFYIYIYIFIYNYYIKAIDLYMIQLLIHTYVYYKLTCNYT